MSPHKPQPLQQLETACLLLVEGLTALIREAAAQAPAPADPTPRYLTVAQLCAKHPAFKERTVRGWVAARATNGLAEAVLELGATGGQGQAP